jgi:transcriptional regulator with XRE-family HTH domain
MRVDYLSGNNMITSEVMALGENSRYPFEMSDAMQSSMRPVGALLREWRQRRRYSQLALAFDAEISPKHLSFVESGRAKPSREMLMHLAERLEVPLRERNVLLLSGGFAPVFRERSLEHQDLASVRHAIDVVLAGHEPYPALAIDRHWNLVAANKAVAPLLVGAAASLLKPPTNVLRLSLHPDGLAPRIVNLAQWRAHLFARLRHQIELSADAVLVALLRELRAYPADTDLDAELVKINESAEVMVPFRLATEHGTLSFISTTMVFGTPVDVTSSELAVETFFPADRQTTEALRVAGR